MQGRAAESHATGVVLGKGWNPRLTLKTFERLWDEMVGLRALSAV